jgi:hypothetical protein
VPKTTLGQAIVKDLLIFHETYERLILVSASQGFPEVFVCNGLFRKKRELLQELPRTMLTA